MKNETITETLKGIAAGVALLETNYRNTMDPISEDQHHAICTMLQKQIESAITMLAE